MKKRKLLQKAITSPKNIQFNEMVTLVEAFGFRLSRVKGSHHIFTHPQVQELGTVPYVVIYMRYLWNQP